MSRYKYAVPNVVRQALKHELRCYKYNIKMLSAQSGKNGKLSDEAVMRIEAVCGAITDELNGLDKFRRAVIKCLLIDCRCSVEAVGTRLPISPSQAYVIINDFIGALAVRLGY